MAWERKYKQPRSPPHRQETGSKSVSCFIFGAPATRENSAIASLPAVVHLIFNYIDYNYIDYIEEENGSSQSLQFGLAPLISPPLSLMVLILCIFFHILSIAERRLTNTKAMSPAFLLSQSFGWLPHWRLTWSKQAIITVHVYITSYRLKPNGILQYRICKALIITLYNYIIKKMKEKRGTRKIMDILLDNIKKKTDTVTPEFRPCPLVSPC